MGTGYVCFFNDVIVSELNSYTIILIYFIKSHQVRTKERKAFKSNIFDVSLSELVPN